MAMKITIGNKDVEAARLAFIAKGGEAEIYDLGRGLYLKLFKEPGHPDYLGNKREQDGARERLREHQRKLLRFPGNLPDSVVKPIEIAYIASRIVGYSMTAISQAEAVREFGQRGSRLRGLTQNAIVVKLRRLRQSVCLIHRAGVVIGDFNDLNLLFNHEGEWFVDADSMQYSSFFCRVFTPGFVDPTLCDPSLEKPVLAHPHTELSDWYAFNVLVFRSLLCVSPYGGIHAPANKQRVPLDARPMKRITVFNQDVRYPKPAIPYKVLPDDLLQHFSATFEKDMRSEFPERLLDVEFKKCSACNVEHARSQCPDCTPQVAVKETTVVRGTVTATSVFSTKGSVLYATIQDGELLYLYHEPDTYKREGGRAVLSGPLQPIRPRLSGQATHFGRLGTVVTMTGAAQKRLNVAMSGTTPCFDANGGGLFWLQGDELLREGALGPERIGSLPNGLSQFWVGETFGLGFYLIGRMQVGFVFNARAAGINDSVRLPKIKGQLVDSTCVFSKDRAFFVVADQCAGVVFHRAVVVGKDGKVHAEAEAQEADGSWLGTIRGKCLVGSHLFAPTDEGIVRVEIQNGKLVETKCFPDTEPFVSAASFLLPGPGGIYVVNEKEVLLLKIK